MLSHSANGWGGWSRVSWPDGLSTMEQPSVAVDAFTIVTRALMHHAEFESGRH